jgi:hypothetical protein
MTSFVVERFDRPGSARDIRAFDAADERSADVLAGRTVWCTAGQPDAGAAARELRACLGGVGLALTAAALPVQGPDERLEVLAQKIDDGVCPGDVVVAHDVLSAALCESVRGRGAHAVWRIRIARRWINPPRQALEFVARFTPGIDAYLLSWVERNARGQTVERVAAAMPSAGIVATKEFPARFPAGEPRRLAWRMALAEAIRSDREEAVGGTLHPRPTVAAR